MSSYQIIENYLLPTVESIIVAIMIILVFRVIRTSKFTTDTYSRVVQTSFDIQEKVAKYEKALFEYGVRLEVIEYQTQTKHYSQGTRKNTSILPPRYLSDDAIDIATSQDSRIDSVGGTERHILTQILNGAKTARDIQAVLGKSREHVARMLKKLYDAGLVSRQSDDRPYTYQLTDTGRQVLEM